MNPDLLQLTCSFLCPHTKVRTLENCTDMVQRIKFSERIRYNEAMKFISEFCLCQVRNILPLTTFGLTARSKAGMLRSLSKLEINELEQVTALMMRFYNPIFLDFM
jgi:hypothetical protein